jgi:hypothetical protein
LQTQNINTITRDSISKNNHFFYLKQKNSGNAKPQKPSDFKKLQDKKLMTYFMKDKKQKVYDFYAKQIHKKPILIFWCLFFRSFLYVNDSKFKLALKDIELMSKLGELSNNFCVLF